MIISFKFCSQEFRNNSNGLNSIFEIFSFACVMFQHDPIIIEEYRNPLIEHSRSIIFLQNAGNSNFQVQQQLSDNSQVDSVFIQLLLYWTCTMNDAKNLKFIYITYYHALNTLKSIFLSSGSNFFIF